MKNKMKILMGILLTSICFPSFVQAYSSKDLTSGDDRYCVYENGTNVNSTIMNQITYKDMNDNYNITIPKGYGPLYFVYNGKQIASEVPEGSTFTIAKSKIKNGKQVQVHRKTTSSICTLGDSKKSGTKFICDKQNNKTCAVGYMKFTTSNCVADEEDLATLFNNSLEVGRNYNNATTSIQIATSSKYYAKVFILNNAKEENVKVITKNGTKYSIPKSYLQNSNVTVYIEYYFANGSCKNKYAGRADITIKGFKTNNLKSVCNGLTAAQKNLIDECSNNYLDADSTLTKEKLEGKFKVVKELSSIKQTSVGNADLAGIKKTSSDRAKKELFCKFNQKLNTTTKYSYNTYEEIDDYFVKVCQETVTITYDSPKLVTNNGGGLTYDVTVTPTVSCYAKIKDDAWEKLYSSNKGTTCKFDHACYGYDKWSPSHFDNGTYDAGPNEEFDSCIKACDNGKYTQSCINSCYSSIYGSKFKSLNYNSTSETSNIFNIAYSRGYSDNKTKYSDEWCILPPSSGSGRYTKSWEKDKRYYYVNDHYYPGSYKCVQTKDENGNNVNVLKYFETLSCGSKCSTTITGKNNQRVVVKDADFANKVKVDADHKINTVSGKKLDCFVNVDGNEISINEKEIQDFVNKWKALVEEIEEINKNGADYSKAKYTYTIHDSTESYCDNTNKNYVTYTNKSSTTPLDVTTSKQNIKLGFPNTCLKNGSYKSKKGCCSTTDGMTGGKKFYMAITTERDINNVYNWPVDADANFTKEEKSTIQAVRDDVEKKITGGLKVWDANTVANADTKEACDANGYKFNYNIKVKLENLGVLGNDGGWNFDINCFYGYYDPNIGSCGIERKETDIDGDGELDTVYIKESLCNEGDPSKQTEGANTQTTTLVNDYIFRTVDVSDLFNQSAVPWNWKTSNTTKAANSLLKAQGITYKIDPDTLVKNIEDTGYAYSNYRNFQFVITSTNMRNIRSYNSNNPNITKTSCSDKKLGCSNSFIKNKSYSGDYNIVEGTFNNMRDRNN